jgi:hypothetical protein
MQRGRGLTQPLAVVREVEQRPLPQHPLQPHTASTRHLTERLMMACCHVVAKKKEPVSSTLMRVTHLNLQHKELCSLEGIEACPNLTHLYAYTNCITELPRSMACMRALRDVILDNNDITDLQGIEALPALRCLSLVGNALAIVSHLPPGLVELRLGHQRLPPGEPVIFDSVSLRAVAATLRVLSVPDCSLYTLADFACLAGVREMDVSGNRLDDVAEVAAAVDGHRLPQLTDLAVKGNPFAAHDVAGNHRTVLIAAAGPHLAMLDGKRVERRHRAFVTHLLQRRAQRLGAGSGASSAFGGGNREDGADGEFEDDNEGASTDGGSRSRSGAIQLGVGLPAAARGTGAGTGRGLGGGAAGAWNAAGAGGDLSASDRLHHRHPTPGMMRPLAQPQRGMLHHHQQQQHTATRTGGSGSGSGSGGSEPDSAAADYADADAVRSIGSRSAFRHRFARSVGQYAAAPMPVRTPSDRVRGARFGGLAYTSALTPEQQEAQGLTATSGALLWQQFAPAPGRGAGNGAVSSGDGNSVGTGGEDRGVDGDGGLGVGVGLDVGAGVGIGLGLPRRSAPAPPSGPLDLPLQPQSAWPGSGNASPLRGVPRPGSGADSVGERGGIVESELSRATRAENGATVAAEPGAAVLVDDASAEAASSEVTWAEPAPEVAAPALAAAAAGVESAHASSRPTDEAAAVDREADAGPQAAEPVLGTPSAVEPASAPAFSPVDTPAARAASPDEPGVEAADSVLAPT